MICSKGGDLRKVQLFTFKFINYDKFNESEGGGQQGC